MPAHIINFEEKFLAEMREIFFESSMKKSFLNEDEKNFFYQKYLGFYVEKLPSWIYVAFDKKVLGYIVSSPASHDEELYSLQPHLKLFENLFDDYPAHLHINCHVETRGQGVGGQLIHAIFDKMKLNRVKGIHIMTVPQSENRNFYRKNDFLFETQSLFNGTPLLFMGKKF